MGQKNLNFQASAPFLALDPSSPQEFNVAALAKGHAGLVPPTHHHFLSRTELPLSKTIY